VANPARPSVRVAHRHWPLPRRETIVDQINFTMSSYSIQIDRRHLMLLADLMTFKGEVLGVCRGIESPRGRAPSLFFSVVCV
jgi:hypothetical protein